MNIKKNLPLILLLATCSASATEVKPYVSAFGGIDFGSKSDIYGHNPLAYQFIVGLAYDVTENIAAIYHVKYFSVRDHNVNRYKLNN